MTSLNFLADEASTLVADASVVINLNATGRAIEIIRALPAAFVVTSNSYEELKRGSLRGYNDADTLELLVAQGLVSIAALDDSSLEIYGALIDGSAMVTLDDGEAATIGHAHAEGGAAIIDEKKGRSLCASMYPSLPVLSTTDLLLDCRVERALGKAAQADAVLCALKGARMRVPLDRVDEVVNLIGRDAAKSCASLPRRKIA
jgi:hypothetical protein